MLTRHPLLAVPSTHAWTSAVTVTVMHWAELGTVIVPVTVPDTVGWVFQVTPVSVQTEVIRRSSCRSSWDPAPGSLGKHKVRVAELMVDPAGMEEISNWTSARLVLLPLPSTFIVVAVPKLEVAWSLHT